MKKTADRGRSGGSKMKVNQEKRGETGTKSAQIDKARQRHRDGEQRDTERHTETS